MVMKNIIIIIILAISTVFMTLNSQSQTPQKYSKAKVYIKSGELNKLASLGVAVDNGQVKKDQYIISDFSEKEISIIRDNGFNYEIIIDDVTKFYQERNKSSKDSINSPKKKSVNAAACSVDKYITPQYFSLGSQGGYYSLEEMLAELDSMQHRFPNLVTIKQQVGTLTTIEGRKLWMVKISDNPNIDETEPEVLYSALTHAREPMGMQQLFFYMYYLLENYNTNSTVKYIVDNTELFFMPCVNPDGYKYNETISPGGGGMHRKNCRNTGGNPKGIDLNRNYGYQWGYDDIGSSPDINNETYRGTNAFSEVESSTMKAFTESHNFKLLIDYHCYSNVLLNPWGYIDQPCVDSAIYRQYSTLMTKTNGFAYGTPNQTIGYNANGGSFDWFYGEQSTKNKIIAFGPEAGDANDGFWPAINRIETIAKSFADMNFYLALFAGKYATINDLGSKFISNSGYLKFNIQSLGLDTPATFTVSIIPISSNIISAGLPVNINNMHFFQTKTDSIAITLSPSIQSGQVISYIYKIQNSYGFYYSDTINKVFGTPVIIFNDVANNMTNWTASATWNTTSTSYYSASKSFTDSPTGNYTDNANKTITTINNISLSTAIYAELSFWAKWDIEAGYDYVEVLASTNGTTWTPLCGKYNHPGNSNQDIDQPLYDGTQSTWVKEQIDLSNYLGQNIKLRFKLISDNFSNFDGYYFDDIKVTVINNLTDINEYSQNNNLQFICNPNPCKNEITFNFPNLSENSTLEIYNVIGEKYKTINLTESSNSISVNTNDLPNGIYFAKFNNSNIVKFVKQ